MQGRCVALWPLLSTGLQGGCTTLHVTSLLSQTFMEQHWEHTDPDMSHVPYLVLFKGAIPLEYLCHSAERRAPLNRCCTGLVASRTLLHVMAILWTTS